MPEHEAFIDGIYHYCDRWCERCTLAARCRVYAMEGASAADIESTRDAAAAVLRFRRRFPKRRYYGLRAEVRARRLQRRIEAPFTYFRAAAVRERFAARVPQRSSYTL